MHITLRYANVFLVRWSTMDENRRPLHLTYLHRAKAILFEIAKSHLCMVFMWALYSSWVSLIKKFNAISCKTCKMCFLPEGRQMFKYYYTISLQTLHQPNTILERNNLKQNSDEADKNLICKLTIIFLWTTK